MEESYASREQQRSNVRSTVAVPVRARLFRSSSNVIGEDVLFVFRQSLLHPRRVRQIFFDHLPTALNFRAVITAHLHVVTLAMRGGEMRELCRGNALCALFAVHLCDPIVQPPTHQRWWIVRRKYVMMRAMREIDDEDAGGPLSTVGTDDSIRRTPGFQLTHKGRCPRTVETNVIVDAWRKHTTQKRRGTANKRRAHERVPEKRPRSEWQLLPADVTDDKSMWLHRRTRRLSRS